MAGAETLLPVLRWQRPLRGGPTGPDGRDLRDHLTEWTLGEAELLGVTGRGALAGPARALLTGADPVPLLDPLLPRPLDHVILQPDLTAVAPGPLLTPLAQALALCADVESKGGATVYRFTPNRCAARWTPAAAPPTCTPSSRSTPVRRCPSRSAT